MLVNNLFPPIPTMFCVLPKSSMADFDSHFLIGVALSFLFSALNLNESEILLFGVGPFTFCPLSVITLSQAPPWWLSGERVGLVTWWL